MIAVQLTKFTL